MNNSVISNYKACLKRYKEERIKIEKNAVILWINKQLEEDHVIVKDLLRDLVDGNVLFLLIKKLYRVDLNSKKSTQYTNLEISLNFLRGQINLRNVESFNVKDNNNAAILRMMWSIINDNEEKKLNVNKNLRKELLIWCKERLKPYKNINIYDFKLSWKNGMALVALIHSQNPEIFDMKKLNGTSDEFKLQLAIRTAALSYNIPPLIDVEDFLLGRIEEKAIITYLHMIKKRFTEEKLKPIPQKDNESFSEINEPIQQKDNKSFTEMDKTIQQKDNESSTQIDKTIQEYDDDNTIETINTENTELNSVQIFLIFGVVFLSYYLFKILK